MQGNHRNVDQYIGELQLALNSVVKESTKFSPEVKIYFGKGLESELRSIVRPCREAIG